MGLIASLSSEMENFVNMIDDTIEEDILGNDSGNDNDSVASSEPEDTMKSRLRRSFSSFSLGTSQVAEDGLTNSFSFNTGWEVAYKKFKEVKYSCAVRVYNVFLFAFPFTNVVITHV